MRTHQTYSLNTILNTQQIRPQLYQQILHQLKSPLEQVSIDLTHDNSLDSVTPKRPNIPPPPPPPKSPLNQLQQCNFSKTHESMSFPAGQSRRREVFHDQVMESFLSPLEQLTNFKEQPSRPPFFCGALLDSVLGSERSLEIQLPARTRISKRRPIFEGKQNSRPSKSAEQVISILLNMGELKMLAFLQLLRDLQCELQQVAAEREQAKKSLSAIVHKMSGNFEFVGQESEDSLTTYRLLRRLRTKNTFELVTKLLREDSPGCNAQAEIRLQTLLQSLGRLEAIVGRFMEKKQSIQILETVYQTMQQAHPQETTLLGQIQRLCQSFGWRLDVCGLQFVWREGARRKLSKQQFVEGVSINDCVIRIPRSFEQQLQSNGFFRNQ